MALPLIPANVHPRKYQVMVQAHGCLSLTRKTQAERPRPSALAWPALATVCTWGVK